MPTPVWLSITLGAIMLSGTPTLPGLTLSPMQAPADATGLSIWTFQLERDEGTTSGVLIRPPGDGPFPGVVVSHGLGGNARGFGLTYGIRFAKAGYVAIACDYTHGRLGGPRPGEAGTGAVAGGARREAPWDNAENERRATACMDILASMPEVDAAKIAMYGNSMGAFLTVRMTQRTDRIRVAALTAGGLRAPHMAPSAGQVNPIRTPFIMLHGDADAVVPLEAAKSLKADLEKRNVPVELIVFPGVGHGLIQERTDEVLARITAFFATHLGLPPPTGQVAVPALAPGTPAQPQPPPAPPPAADGEPQWVKPPIEAPHTQYRTFESKTLGAPVSYLVYLPPGYDTGEARYPVMYWLHGRGGAQTGIPAFVRRLTGAIEAAKTPPMIVVFANGLPFGGWVDSADGKQPVETVTIRDLIPHIDATYRTIATREARIVEGFSMGGSGAARFGFKHPELFGAISILAGALHDADSIAQRGESFGSVYGGSREHFEANSPWTLAEKNAEALRGRTAIRIVVGSQDGLLERNRTYHELLERLKIAHEFHVIEGAGHNHGPLYDGLGEANWAFYRAALPKQ